jgi:signal transduction histidine kinase/CheY-like chemotaxis protein
VPNPVEIVLEAGEIVGLANHTLLIAKDGTEYHIADSGAPIRDAKNNIIGVVLVFRDVTEKARAEQEHLKLTKLESLGLLAGGIAHDFNNLLTGLFGNIGLIKMSLAADHKAHKYVDRAMRAMEHTTALTNQLLTFAKGGDPIKEVIAIGEVITETAQFSLRGSHVGLQTYIQPDLWLVEADKGQLSQVISNLVINGQQAMPTGGMIAIAVENIVISGDNYVQITVQDEGVGIAPQYLDKVFDPYFTTKQKGNGLGLASVYSIISKHNGRITVDSKLNEGAVFTIHLSAIEETEAARTGKLSPEPQMMPEFAAHILVLDDEEGVREVLGDMVEEMGHKISYAIERQEAIAKYRTAYENEAAYDLVITDLTIPGGLGGEATAQEILKLNPQAKIIVSSGYATDPVLANYEAYGFKGIVVKPYRFTELQEVVRHVLYSAHSS